MYGQVYFDILKTIENEEVKENTIIVYDIDGTLIDFNGNPIFPIIKTYQHAKDKGFIPAIITARPASLENIDRTLEQLSYFGITDYKFIYFLPQNKKDQASYKLLARKNLHEKGYKIAISIGDMPWDIGEYGGKGFRV